MDSIDQRALSVQNIPGSTLSLIFLRPPVIDKTGECCRAINVRASDISCVILGANFSCTHFGPQFTKLNEPRRIGPVADNMLMIGCEFMRKSLFREGL